MALTVVGTFDVAFVSHCLHGGPACQKLFQLVFGLLIIRPVRAAWCLYGCMGSKSPQSHFCRRDDVAGIKLDKSLLTSNGIIWGFFFKTPSASCISVPKLLWHGVVFCISHWSVRTSAFLGVSAFFLLVLLLCSGWLRHVLFNGFIRLTCLKKTNKHKIS